MTLFCLVSRDLCASALPEPPPCLSCSACPDGYAPGPNVFCQYPLTSPGQCLPTYLLRSFSRLGWLPFSHSFFSINTCWKCNQDQPHDFLTPSSKLLKSQQFFKMCFFHEASLTEGCRISSFLVLQHLCCLLPLVPRQVCWTWSKSPRMRLCPVGYNLGVLAQVSSYQLQFPCL